LSKLRISDRLTLPADVVTSTIVVYGGKGMGKTNLGSVLVEELAKAQLRFSVLDPLGVWWGLRHAKDGKGPGIECLILGGVHGDIPIEPTGGAVVADLVVDEPASVIIDFSRKPSGEMWGIGEKTRFLTDYALRLFQRQGGLVNGGRREPIFQILDEAARYIPQILPAGNPELAKCLSAWNTLVEEGRNVGIGVGLLTQRSARMNKSVSELADAMFSFRIVGPNSIAAVTEWLGEHVPKDRMKQHVESLRSLERGRCLVVSPGWLRFEDVVMIRARETFDSSATPKPGEKARRVTGPAAKPDLAKYAERMRATIERAKESDPAALKRRIAELKGKLEKQAKATPKAVAPEVNSEKVKAAVEKSVRAAIKERDMHWTRSLRDFRRAASKALTNGLDTLSSVLNAVAFEPPPPVGEVSADVTISSREVSAPPRKGAEDPRSTSPRGSEVAAVRASSNGNLSNPQLRILAALAQFEAIGRPEVPKKWIAALAGVSHASGSYGNNLGMLRSGGYIHYPDSGMVALTENGRSKAPMVDAPTSTEEMVARCKEIVSGPQARILDVLVERYPHAISKRELAERTGVSPDSGSFGNNLGALRSAGMIEYPESGKAKAAAWLLL
jgi:uncharacterized protein